MRNLSLAGASVDFVVRQDGEAISLQVLRTRGDLQVSLDFDFKGSREVPSLRRGKADGRRAQNDISTCNTSRRRSRARLRPFTLGVDIGGTNIKASVLDAAGVLAAEQIRSPTPKPATPQAVLDTIARLAAQLPPFHRISVGFPGVVKGGRVVTAPNLGTGHWAGFQLIDALAERFGTPGAPAQRCGRAGPGRGRGPRARMRADAGDGRRLRAVPQPPPAAASRARAAPRPQGQDLRPVHRPGGAGGERAGALEPARAQGDRLR